MNENKRSSLNEYLTAAAAVLILTGIILRLTELWFVSMDMRTSRRVPTG